MLSGPTLFAEVIEAASARAARAMKEQNYTVLLIATDGVINDMQKTVNAYVGLSCLICYNRLSPTMYQDRQGLAASPLDCDNRNWRC
jgi:hypothetical protein